MKKSTSLLALFVAFVLTLGAPAGADASDVQLGTLTPFTGGDAGEGLDLSGDIIFAFNLGGTEQTVQGVNFAAAPLGSPPAGITTTAANEFDYTSTNDGLNATDYGDTADDNALESMTTFIWYDTNWTFDLATVPDTEYQLQLILQEGWKGGQGTEIRNFDVSVETEAPSTLSLAIDDLVLGMETNGIFQEEDDFGLVYTYRFTAPDDSFRVGLDENPGSLAVLAALTLSGVSGQPDPGDFNNDGSVTLADFAIMKANFKEPGGFSEGDMNFDGLVNMTDFGEFFPIFMAENPGQALAVPEPSTLLLGMSGLLLLLLHRRRR